jgi:hypothetical protein
MYITPKQKSLKGMKQKLIEVWKQKKLAILVRDFSTSFSTIDKTTRKKITKAI